MTKGWDWVLADLDAFKGWHSTGFADEFDGIYLASCPRCGQDCYWEAHSNEPMCNCDTGQGS